MFEQQFGLNKRPFGGHAVGADVFVTPQTARLVGRAQKLFAEPDAVLCVSGPVGCGKSTIVARTLSAIGLQHTIIQVGRVKLGPDEVLEFLLRELGLKQMPAGTLQKLTVFRQLLAKFAENNIRLFIVVEDAERLGPVALAELETLSAGDSGVATGASLILMAEQPFNGLLANPALARLRQRARLHHAVAAMSAAEVRGYLAHGIHQAGSDIADIIEDDAVPALHALSEGIPRVLNNLVSSSLVALADTGKERLDGHTVARIASEEYGIEANVPATTGGPAAAPLDDEPGDTSDPGPVAAAADGADAPPDLAQEPRPELADEPQPEAPTEPEPLAAERQFDSETGTPGLADLPSPDSGFNAQHEADSGEPPAATAPPPGDDAAVADDAAVQFEPAVVSPVVVSPAVVSDESDEFQIPELIQDTLPDLEILAPELAHKAFDEESEEEPPTVTDLFAADLPESAPETPDAAEAEALQTDSAELPLLTSATGQTAALTDTPPPMQAGNTPAGRSSAETPAATQDDAIPTLFETTLTSSRTADTTAGDETGPADEATLPDWDRDPTLAELTPDLDALENALADIDAGASGEKPAPLKESEPAPADIPTITLDDSIRRKIDLAEEALKASETLSEPGPDPDAMSNTVAEDLSGKPEKADAELERIAAELSRAKSLEDVDDKLAETLFGEEFTMLAAEVAANSPDRKTAEEQPPADASTAATGGEAEEALELSLVETSAGMPAPEARPSVGEAAGASSLEQEFKETWGENALEVSIETKSGGGMDLSASQRLATVRALNAGNAAGRSPGASEGKAPKSAPQKEPDPIEDQINTSITQTLEALSSSQIENLDDDDDEPKPGFFSRFRKS